MLLSLMLTHFGISIWFGLSFLTIGLHIWVTFSKVNCAVKLGYRLRLETAIMVWEN